MADSNKDEPTKEAAPADEQEEQAVVAFYYLPENNPQNAQYAGVPLRNLLEHEVEAYPKWIQHSLKESPMYSAEQPKYKAGAKTDTGGKK